MVFNGRGLPTSASLTLGVSGTTTTVHVMSSASYNLFGQSVTTVFGGTARNIRRSEAYDVRQRPTRIYLTRPVTAGSTSPSLNAVSGILDEYYYWDGASNLIEVRDNRQAAQWPDVQRPHRYRIKHDALYRVASVDYTYRSTSNAWTTTGNPATDWRAILRTPGSRSTRCVAAPRRASVTCRTTASST